MAVIGVFLLFHKWLFVVHAYVTQNRGADKKTFLIELSICKINLLPKKDFPDMFPFDILGNKS